MKIGKKKWSKELFLIALLVALVFQVGCAATAETQQTTETVQTTEAPQTTATPETTKKAVSPIVLATTTSTDQTGLLDALIPDFTEKTGIEVKVVAVGTGQALEMGKNGEADVVLVHAKASEVQFVEEGYGVERFDVMYNDFVLLGAEPLPEALKNDIIGAFEYLSSEEKTFVSRGDDSGTHKKELAIWKAAGIEPSGDWYVSAGKGMGDVIQMADEMQAYTLSDRGTFLSMRNDVELQVVVEKSTDLFNQYGVIAVNPDKNPGVHIDEATQFVQWILSKETQEKIAVFGKEEFGQALFVPNAEE